MKYFTNLPTVSYGNTFARNIMTRTKISNDIRKNGSSYYPYVLQESSAGGLKYENIAFDYYDEADRVWILHLTNEITDPYYDLPLTEEDFNKFIVKKYVSLQRATSLILFYRNNFDQDDTIMSISGYEALIPERKKYWTLSTNYNNKIIGYERAKDTTTVTTNKVITMEITANSALSIGESVTQSTSGATGWVTFSNTSQLTLQHIQGSFSNLYSIIGTTSLKSCTPTAEIITVAQNISDNVAIYFSPVTAYEYERQLNESKKNIYIMDKKYTTSIESSFAELMRK